MAVPNADHAVSARESWLEAKESWMSGSMDDLFEALIGLQGPDAVKEETGGRSRLDFRRQHRKGVPEVVLAEGKEPSDVVAIAREFLNSTGRAIISRVDASLVSLLQHEFSGSEVDVHRSAATVVIHRGVGERPKSGGVVGIITAGTSDVGIAEQARIVCEEMGCEVFTAFDVGVAGMHRLFQPLQRMLEAQVDVLIVAAGMDGALPSVVAGLADVPVIGLPTSRGYGLGGRGLAALLSMLQSCSPGLTVVNIDNAVGAAAAAGLIANRAAKARRAAGA